MKRLSLLILTCSMIISVSAQINEHSDRKLTITFGGLNPLIQKSQTHQTSQIQKSQIYQNLKF